MAISHARVHACDLLDKYARGAPLCSFRHDACFRSGVTWLTWLIIAVIVAAVAALTGAEGSQNDNHATRLAGNGRVHRGFRDPGVCVRRHEEVIAKRRRSIALPMQASREADLCST